MGERELKIVSSVPLSMCVRNTVLLAAIGGGFVGVEMAENLSERGLEVTLVEAAPHILVPFDTDMVLTVEKELLDNRVKLTNTVS